MIAVRPYNAGDLENIAHIHTRVWQTAYAGQIPQAYLDSLDSAARLKRWKAIFANQDTNSGTLVAQAQNRTVGFLSWGPGRDEDRGDWGEIYAVYVLQDQAGNGAGYALFKAAHEILRGQNREKAYLWALAGNKEALRAYEKWGGQIEPQREKATEIGGAMLKEISIKFDL